MKMKMYLRGVGTGVVCTAIIMGLALGRNKTMSQEEIMAKAKEYGMVDASEMASQVAKAKADALSEANAKIAAMKEENKDTASSSQDAAGSGSSVSSGSTVNSDPNPQVMGASRAGSQMIARVPLRYLTVCLPPLKISALPPQRKMRVSLRPETPGTL